MKSFFAIALAALSVDAVRLQLEQAAHNVGCDFKDANSQVVADLRIGADMSDTTTLGADQP